MNRRIVAVAILLAAAAGIPGRPPAARAAGPQPTIESIVPNEGTVVGGVLVTITGTNFSEPMEVRFDGLAAPGVTVNSPTELVCSTPPHVRGAVDVVVTQTADPPSVSEPAIAAFTYVDPPVHTWVPRARGADTGGNPGGFDVTVVDTANRRVAASLDLNASDTDLPDDQDWRPTQILFDSTGDHAFIATAGTPGSLDSRKVFIVRTARLLGSEEGDPILAVVDTGGNPYQIALNGTGTSLYVADGGSWAGSSTILPAGRFRAYDVTVRSAPTPLGTGFAVTGILPTLAYDVATYQGWGTNSSFRGVLQAKSGRTVVTNAGTHDLTVINLSNLAFLTTVDVGVEGGGLLQVTTSLPSPYSDDFLFVQTTDLGSSTTEYFIYRITEDDLIAKGPVAIPVRFFPVLPFPDLQNRLAWPHVDGESLVAVPATDASVAAFNPATGSALVRTAVQGGGPPSSLAYNDASGFFYAREADGGWTVLSVPETTTGGAAPVEVTRVADATGIGSLRVIGNGSTLVGTAASSLSFIAGGATSPMAHQVEESLALPLDPDGGGVFPQPGPNGGGPRTFVQVQAGGIGPAVVIPLAGSEFCADDGPPAFEFTPGFSQAPRYELELGSQYDFLRGPGAATRTRRVGSGSEIVVPGRRMWLRVLRAAAGDVDRPLYARVNAITGDGTRIYGETVSFGVCAPEPCTAISPAGGAAASRSPSPVFTFGTGGGGSFWIEFAGPDGFDGRRLARIRARGPFPGGTGSLDPGAGRWQRIVNRARRASGGFPATVTWRVRCRDALRRETFSDPRTLFVNP